jgi:hypothetical protein
MNTLPSLISWIGHGAACLEPPGVFTDATCFLFGVRASAAAMQHLADTLLAPVASGTVRYEPLADFALVTFLDEAQCTSGKEPIGWLPGRECAIWVPLLEKTVKKPILGDRLVLWAPYIFIDYAIGMATGREIWGWPKVIAKITLPRDVPNQPPNFECTTTLFRTLTPQTRGECSPLFTVTGTSLLAPATPDWPTGRDAVLRLLSHLLGETAELAISLLNTEPVVPAIVLKQFADSETPTQACYQAIVNSPCRFTRFDGAGPLFDKFTLTINTFASHAIVADIFGGSPGINNTLVPVEAAAWAKFDFQAPAGGVIADSARATNPVSAFGAFWGRLLGSMGSGK